MIRMLGLATTVLAAGSCLFLPGYYAYLAATVATTTLVGVGLNVLLGLAGEVSLGQVGFVALGAYGVGILTATYQLPFALALPIAVVIVLLVAVLVAIPTLRVSGPYLAMTTIAFGFIVVSAATEWQTLTGGASGLAGIPPPNLGGHAFTVGETAALSIIFAALTLYGFAWLKRSPLGLAMRAGADAPVAAAGLGIDLPLVRICAFVLSAGAAGLAGGLQAPLTGLVAPSSFPFSASILFLLVVVVGGTGGTLGPLIGAILVVLLPQLIANFAEYQLLLFGAGLFLVLRSAPRGIAGALARFRLVAPQPRSPAGDVAFSASPHRDSAGLEARDLSVAFGGVRAVSGVGFTAPLGRITSIIGPNGAGKTTLLNLIAGVQKPDAGSVSVGGVSLEGLRSHWIARRGIARTYQTTQLFGSLSVIDNVRTGLLHGRLRALADPAVARQLLTFVGCIGDPGCRAEDLPHVNRRLVEIARALATRPSVLLLDEPAAGLDSDDTNRLGAILQQIARSGVAVVLVEHDVGLVLRVSDHVVVLDAGRKIAEGRPEAMRTDPAVRAAYLGAGSAPQGRRRLTASGQEILAVSGLSAGYGTMPVLRDLSFGVRQGELLAVMGPNGAGKSTLMRALSGLLRPVTGSIRFGDADLSREAGHRVARHGLVLVPEGRMVFPLLSVRDNLRLGAGKRPDLDDAVAAMLRRFPLLAERLATPAGMLSGGEQQMLALARGLLARPKLLLLDEPSLGLAPMMVEQLFAALASLREEGMTLLVADQMAYLAVALADRSVVLSNGRTVQSDTEGEAPDIDALGQVYLGDQARSLPRSRGAA